MTSRNGKQLQSFKGVTKILNFELRKILISINVPSEIRAYRWEKISEINKRTGTFISYCRVIYNNMQCKVWVKKKWTDVSSYTSKMMNPTTITLKLRCN